MIRPAPRAARACDPRSSQAADRGDRAARWRVAVVPGLAAGGGAARHRRGCERSRRGQDPDGTDRRRAEHDDARRLDEPARHRGGSRTRGQGSRLSTRFPHGCGSTSSSISRWPVLIAGRPIAVTGDGTLLQPSRPICCRRSRWAPRPGGGMTTARSTPGGALRHPARLSPRIRRSATTPATAWSRSFGRAPASTSATTSDLSAKWAAATAVLARLRWCAEPVRGVAPAHGVTSAARQIRARPVRPRPARARRPHSSPASSTSTTTTGG